MNKLAIAIAVSLSFSGAAAADTGAFADLLAASAGLTAPAAPVVPGAVPASAADRALKTDVSDLAVAQADALVAQARAAGYAVFQLDGSRMTTKPALMAHVAKVLGLPKDMDNWDAMIDYMGDMPQIHCNDKLLVVVRNSSRIKSADQKLYADFRDVVQLSVQRATQGRDYVVNIKFVFVP